MNERLLEAKPGERGMPGARLELALPEGEGDFKSPVSTSSTTRARGIIC
jgi:hypothetical protein